METLLAKKSWSHQNYCSHGPYVDHLCNLCDSILCWRHFIEQWSLMNKKIGKWKFPSQVLPALYISGKIKFDSLAWWFLYPMSAHWLFFQFCLLVGLDSFLKNSIHEFYDNESFETMRRYLYCFAEGVFSQGCMCSVLSAYVVGKIIEKRR